MAAASALDFTTMHSGFTVIARKMAAAVKMKAAVRRKVYER